MLPSLARCSILYSSVAVTHHHRAPEGKEENGSSIFAFGGYWFP